jgi:hypothetical protein
VSQFPSVKLPAKARFYLLNHVFLPPQLPQEDDYDAAYESVLLVTVGDALDQFKALVSKQHRDIVDAVTKMVTLLRWTRGPNGEVNEDSLRQALETLGTSGECT